MLSHGWAKVKDLEREATDDDLRRKGLESEAKSASRGQWNPHGPKVSTSTLHLVSRASPFLPRRDGSYTTCPWIHKDSLMNGRGNNWMVHNPSFHIYN
jgi:hypothetical protein